MYHQTIAIGNLGADPEEKTMPNGNSVCNFSVAASEKWGTGDDRKEHTEWYRCTAFGRTAEIAAEYLKKGRPVTVIGRMRTEKWTDKEGVERYSTKLIVDRLVLMPSGERSNNETRNEDRAERPAKKQADNSSQRPAADGDFDDDIPF